MGVEAPEYQGAGAYYRTALDALGATPGRHQLRARLLLGLGEAQRRFGDTVAARQAFLDAARHARSVGDAELLSQAALGYGLGAGGLHRAARCDLQHIALLEEAMSALGAVETPLRVRLLARLAEELYFTPESVARAALSGEAVAMALRLGDKQVLLAALHARELGRVGPDLPLDERVAAAGELIELARELHDDEAEYLGEMLRELALVESGRIREASAALDAAEVVANRIGMASLQAWAVGARARQHWLAGEFDEAEKANAEAMVLATQQGGDPEIAQLVVGGQLLSMQLLRRDLEPFVGPMEAYRLEYPHLEVLRCFTAYAYLLTGRVDSARAAFAEMAARGFLEGSRTTDWPAAMWALSRLAYGLDDVVSGARLLTDLAPCSGRWFADWAANCLGPVDTCLGLLCSLVGDHERAIGYFESALARATDAPSPPWLADVQVQYAAALLSRNAAGDNERARALLTTAIDTCARLGLDGLVPQAKSLSGRL